MDLRFRLHHSEMSASVHVHAVLDLLVVQVILDLILKIFCILSVHTLMLVIPGVIFCILHIELKTHGPEAWLDRHDVVPEVKIEAVYIPPSWPGPSHNVTCWSVCITHILTRHSISRYPSEISGESLNPLICKFVSHALLRISGFPPARSSIKGCLRLFLLF